MVRELPTSQHRALQCMADLRVVKFADPLHRGQLVTSIVWKFEQNLVAYGDVATTEPHCQAVLDELQTFAQSPLDAIRSLSVVSAAGCSLAKPYNVASFA